MKAMVLPAPATWPPTVLLDDWLEISTPEDSFGSGAVPSAAVPMRLPTICVLVDWTSRTPVAPLVEAPDMRLPALGAVPPIVALSAWKTVTPWPLLGTAAVPAELVPM